MSDRWPTDSGVVDYTFNHASAPSYRDLLARVTELEQERFDLRDELHAARQQRDLWQRRAYRAERLGRGAR